MSLTIATGSDLPSLSTIVQRSFHSNNEYFHKTFPDTPLIREWWSNLFLDAIRDPEYQVLVVKDPSSSYVQGIILLNRGLEDAAVFKRQPPTSDHDLERYQAMLESEKNNTAGQVERHFGIELLGVSDEAKGKGYGKMLLREACRIADAEGMNVPVTANVGVRAFYEKVGFVCEQEIVLNGEDEYGQVRMVYRARKA